MTKRVPIYILVCVAALWVVARPAPADACPNCKAALQQAGDGDGAGGSGGNPARGYYLSILAMLGTLSLVAGGLVRLMVQAARQTPPVPAAPGEAETIGGHPRTSSGGSS